jgi:hypothetical protein
MAGRRASRVGPRTFDRPSLLKVAAPCDLKETGRGAHGRCNPVRNATASEAFEVAMKMTFVGLQASSRDMTSDPGAPRP